VTHQHVAIVTGASRGIGAATARRLAADGFAVCVNYLAREDAAATVVADIERSGGRAIAVRCDVADEAAVVAMFDRTAAELGPVDALVNNAAIVRPQMRLERMSRDRLERVFATNVIGTFLCCREAVKRMSTQHGGRGGAIVNVSSGAARLGSPNEYVDYAATKGAIDTLTRGLSLEVAGEGIRVNCVRPGFIATDMHASAGEPGRIERLRPMIPLGRGGTADEVAAAIAWLLSPEASYSTGAFIDVTGGR
jgi:NAD(P)-dependent dehydrogenase (short-subunit alcohol dehydrogenase family)